MAILPFLFAIIIKHLTIFCIQFSSATDIITRSKPLADGSTLVSKDGSFELGFFNPPTSTKRYVGIWFHNIPHQTVVWVANRDNPIIHNSSMLTINTQGNLVLVTRNNTVLWSANSTTTNTTSSPNPIVQLLDSGNLVLRDEKQSLLWQSFDYPCDTLLAGMKVGWELKKGINQRLTAWRNWDDPSQGDLSWGISFGSLPELVMWKGSSQYHRSGPWNGIRFSGSPLLKPHQLFNYQFVTNQDEAYYSFTLKNKSLITRIVMNQTTLIRQRYIWHPENQAWSVYLSVPGDNCDIYNQCGPYGNCAVGELPICQCLNGFKPKSPHNWDAIDFSEGCVPIEAWSCGVKGKDGFNKFSGLKLPDTTRTWINRSMTLEECKAKCLNNCSCKAYANIDIRGEGSGCVIWFGDLIDIRVVPTAGQDLYIRMVVSDTEAVHGDADEGGNKKKITLVVSFTVLLLLAMLFTFSYFHYWRKRKSRREKIMSTKTKDECEEEHMELPLFDLSKIVDATNAFSAHNKLGEGGFGPVYRAWKMWKHGKPTELIDASLGDSFIMSEVLRCIQIGLLCVQQHPDDRPNMGSVVTMLSSENALFQPKEPGFLIEKSSMNGVQSYSNEILSSSTNEITITLLEAR
ncbi:G-type lectin S-receptor-like serine/threonine-protein kinase [Senna tora]|uniref:non-specific serine/threonine protein kinase n=1 Tax=Senna tora TaxID=362788 RepID=A0A834TKJ2_9FABA|nr:G-type lectin S-receptor-like serine/threonine-protein kinase [Senna tora]